MGSRQIKILSLLLALVLILSGCTVQGGPGDINKETTQHQKNGKQTVLRVLVEEGRDQIDIFYMQVVEAVEQFEADHPNIRIQLEELPDDAEHRAIVLETYRVEMMAGKGPDVLLLPSQAQASFDFMYVKEQLIPDINVAMRNGIFMDVGAYYEADDGLGKDALQQTVMEAGVLDGVRYVLPLQFTYPAVFYLEDRLAEAGLSEDVLRGGVIALMDEITKLGDPQLAGQGWPRHLKWIAMDFFPELLDYDNQEVLLEKDSVVDFMDSYQAYLAVYGGAQRSSSASATLANFLMAPEIELNSVEYWGIDGHCLQIAKMDTAVSQAALAKANALDVKMLPLTGPDGELVAEVTMYGAVCNGSKNPEMAYEFLREFLLEPVQWEQDLPLRTYSGSGEGYPVRVIGSAEPMYKSLYQREVEGQKWDGPQTPEQEERNRRVALLETVTVTDEDVPILRAQIDKARFPLSDLERALANIVEVQLNDFNTGAPLDVDIDALAENYVEEFKWHLFES